MTRRERDRDLYHGGPNGSQTPEAGHIGMPDENGLLYCVGCAWCEAPTQQTICEDCTESNYPDELALP